MYAPYDEHHKVSSFLNSHKNTHNSFKYGTLQRSKLTFSKRSPFVGLPGLEIVTKNVANGTSFFSLAPLWRPEFCMILKYNKALKLQ